jgi:hypothetical protein
MALSDVGWKGVFWDIYCHAEPYSCHSPWAWLRTIHSTGCSRATCKLQS